MIYLGNTPVGVGIKGVGEFTKYEQVKVNGTNGDLIINHDLGVVPKMVIVKSNQTYVSTNYMTDGFMDRDCGLFKFMSGATTFGTYMYSVLINEEVTGTQQASMSSATITILKGAATRRFDNDTEYTVDIYA